MTDISGRAVAFREAGRAISYIANGHAVTRCTLRHTRIVEAAIPREHEGIARWAAIDSVALLCASATGHWQLSALMAVEKLAHDRAMLDAWHAAATALVLAHQTEITKVAEALLRHGTLSGNEVLEAAHAPARSLDRPADLAVVPLNFGITDPAWAEVAAWQSAQAHATYRLGTRGVAS